MDRELQQALAAIEAGADPDAVAARMSSDTHRQALAAVRAGADPAAVSQRLANLPRDDGFGAGDALRMAAQGFTFGFGDEIAGLGAAIVPGGRSYSEARDASRRRLDKLREEHPVASIAFEMVGGALVPVGTLASALRGGAAVARGAVAATRGARALRAAKQAAALGAAEGAVFGAGEADGGLADRAIGAVTGGAIGAATGGIIGGAAGALQRSVSPAAARVIQGEADEAGAALVPPPAQGASDFLTEAETGLARMTAEGERIQQNLDVARAAAAGERTVVPHRATIEEARQAVEVAGLDPTKIKSDRHTPAAVLGMAQRVQQDTDEMLTLTGQLQQGVKPDGTPFSPQELAKLQDRIDFLTESINGTAAELGQAGTEAGRQLNIFRLLARRGGPQENRTAWLIQAQKMKGSALTDQELATLNGIIDSGDVGELQYRISRLAPRTGLRGRAQQAVNLFRAVLLTNPPPHIANVLGNAAMAGFREVSDAVGYGLDRLIAKAIPNAVGASKANPLTRYADQARASGAAAKEAANILGLTRASRAPFQEGDGARAAVRAWAERIRRGTMNPDDLRKTDFRQIHFENPAADVLAKLSFVAMDAGDRVFRAPAFVGSIADQATGLAAREGLRGQALRQRAMQLIDSPTPEMVMQAMADAERAVFMEQGNVARAVNTLRRVLGPTGDLLMPFTTFASNVGERLVTELSPVGTMRGAVKLAKIAMGKVPKGQISAEQRRAVDLLAQSTVASGGPILLGYTLASMGLMTGPGMTPERRAFYDSVGGKPNSMKVGDTWYRIDRFAPVASLMMTGAAMHEALNTENLEGLDLALGVAGAATATPLELSPVQGVRDLLNVLSESGSSGTRGTRAGRLFGNVIGSAVAPPVVARTAAALDDRERVADTFGERIQARVPFLRERLPSRVDVLGTTVPQRGGLSAFGVLSPTADRTVGDPVRAELRRLDIGLRPPPRKRDETTEDYELRARLYGRQAERDLFNVLVSRDYQLASDVEKKKLLRDALSSSRGRLTRQLNRR